MNVKKILRLFIGMLALCISNGLNAQSKHTLSPDEFETQLKTASAPQLVDVRTPVEYKEKHLKNSLNIDYKGDQFQELITHLDKSKPVYVYCLSGARSAAAAKIMRQQGFNQVLEMEGGISKWLNENKPLERAAKNSSAGMTLQQFNTLIAGKKLVLVDFNAKWCAPCKKMIPVLDKLGKEQSATITIVSVDIDANETIAKHFNVVTLPALMLFKDAKQLSRHEGFLNEAGLMNWIEKFD